ncbi:MAG: hypothetical protein JSW39_20540 [Desulfobacterales bacterium]|nr:MAG: hypothetical protein JSW39_20540 [Desulfobacterales bacterium]
MSPLTHILKEYATLESKVRDAIALICLPHCAACRHVCCRPEFCRETLESPFLSLLLAEFPPAIPFQSERGWLTEIGCALTVGRPPVCYEFLCKKIMGRHPQGNHLYAVKVLSHLITHVGKNAAGRRHLVELAGITKLNFTRLRKHLAEANSALGAICRFLASGNIESTSLQILGRILPRPLTNANTPGISQPWQ